MRAVRESILKSIIDTVDTVNASSGSGKAAPSVTIYLAESMCLQVNLHEPAAVRRAAALERKTVERPAG